MGLVEGLTEFLPVSSTGHLVLAGAALDFDIPGKETFIIAIQFAAILAVMWEYRARLLRMALHVWKDKKEQRLAANVAIAFLPAAVIGVLFNDIIEEVLFSPVPVALALIIGGFVIFWAEKRQHKTNIDTIDAITWKDALKIGLVQCFALVPGTSRSGATIVGGLLFGLSRTAATEFSFFLAMPTIAGATVYALWKARDTLTLAGQGGLYITASVVAFASAFASVRWLLKYVGNHDFRPFAWYRIGFGLLVLALALTGGAK